MFISHKKGSETVHVTLPIAINPYACNMEANQNSHMKSLRTLYVSLVGWSFIKVLMTLDLVREEFGSRLHIFVSGA